MTPPIVQSVTFKASPKKLYDLYMTPRLHAAFTGSPVTISSKPGSKFTAFNSMLTGKMLLAIPGKLVVQAWRSMNFKKTDPDSILILYFSGTAKSGTIDMTHINVPAQDHAGVTNGWKKYYWTPLKKYLK